MSHRNWFLLLPSLLLACGGEGPLVVRGRDSGAQAGAGVGGAGDGLAGAPQGPAGSGGSAQGGAAGQVSGGSGGSGGSSGAGAGGAPIRTVSQRSPFGNVKATDNLLWDGDFEWSGAFIQQYSWSSGKTWSVSGAPDIGVFGACRSGMKCARLKKGGSMGGLAVSPRTPTTAIRGWVRMGTDDTCKKVSLYLSSCFDNDSLVKPAAATTEAPDAEGWCRYEDERPTLDRTPCVFVINKAKGEVFADDFYVGPGSTASPPGSPSAAPPPGAAASAADLEASALIGEIRDELRRHRRGTDAPPRRPPTSFPEVRRAPPR